ncbi:hypothetical protein BS78_K281400 [Paspalum vaginatum]|uniref:Uncharacterized protein n=1 Tax=Paspalum vaginatum TaxID=158149 RepID=A0A9W8CFH0_9POAL|nr:hypothetical protein BS78_K281400 [Paspalum vaginatum]
MAAVFRSDGAGPYLASSTTGEPWRSSSTTKRASSALRAVFRDLGTDPTIGASTDRGFTTDGRWLLSCSYNGESVISASPTTQIPLGQLLLSPARLDHRDRQVTDGVNSEEASGSSIQTPWASEFFLFTEQYDDQCSVIQFLKFFVLKEFATIRKDFYFHVGVVIPNSFNIFIVLCYMYLLIFFYTLHYLAFTN